MEGRINKICDRKIDSRGDDDDAWLNSNIIISQLPEVEAQQNVASASISIHSVIFSVYDGFHFFNQNSQG